MKKDKKTKATTRSIGPYIIDLFLLSSIITFVFLESFHVIKTSFCFPIIVDIILILLPTIITIVSIVLSLSKEKIYGVTLSEFNKLRGFWFYHFLHMVLCLSCIFVAYTILSVFSLTFTIYILDAASLFLSVYFSLQEIPVLMQNSRRIGKIIKKRYKTTNKSLLLGKQIEEKILKTAILNIILSDGIYTAYQTLKENNNEEYNANLLNDLFELQNRFFWDAIEDIEFIKADLNGLYRGIEIANAIDVGFSNVESVLRFKKDFDYKNIVKDGDETYQITRSLFSLYSICNSTGLVTKKEKRLTSIANQLLLYSFSTEKEANKIYSFVTLMSISTLSKGETWFIKALRDSDYSIITLFSLDRQPFGLFLSVLIAYLIEAFPNSEVDLSMFINEPIGGLNGDGTSWKKHISRMIEYSDSDRIINLLPSLLEIYNSINSSYFENIFIKRNGVVQDYHGFEKEHLFNAWIEIILFAYNYRLESDSVHEVLNNLSIGDKEKLAYYLPRKWIKCGQLNKTAKLEFLHIFSDDKIEVSEDYYNKKIINVFSDFHKAYFKKDLDEKAEKSNPDLDKIKKILEEPFIKLKSNEFFDDKISLDDEKPLVYNLRVEGYDFNGLVEAYSRSLEKSISYFVRESTFSVVNEKYLLETSGYRLTEKSKKRIQKFNPDYVSESNYLSLERELSSFIPGVRLVKNDFLPDNFFGKGKAFAFNVQLINPLCGVRFLSNDEIEQIIEKEYQMINGMYQFGDINNDEIRSFLVTREELVQYLKKKIIYVQLVFKKKVVLKDTCYLIINRKEK